MFHVQGNILLSTQPLEYPSSVHAQRERKAAGPEEGLTLKMKRFGASQGRGQVEKKTNTSRQIKTSYPYIFDSGIREIILSLDISNIQYSIYIWPQRCKRRSLHKIASKRSKYNLAHLLTSMTIMQKIYKELVISYSKLSEVTLWAFYILLNDFFQLFPRYIASCHSV